MGKIVAVFGNLVKQTIARNSKKVTNFYKVAELSFHWHFWQYSPFIVTIGYLFK